MNICVVNLSRETKEDNLRYAFSAFGQVRSVSIIRDETSGESQGCVSMPVENEARTAIREMSGKNLHGRIIQAVGQAKTNIRRSRDRPGASRGERGGTKRDGHGRAHRGKRQKSRRSMKRG
jgi:RNA recognition motif-containing protein